MFGHLYLSSAGLSRADRIHTGEWQPSAFRIEFWLNIQWDTIRQWFTGPLYTALHLVFRGRAQCWSPPFFPFGISIRWEHNTTDTYDNDDAMDETMAVCKLWMELVFVFQMRRNNQTNCCLLFSVCRTIPIRNIKRTNTYLHSLAHTHTLTFHRYCYCCHRRRCRNHGTGRDDDGFVSYFMKWPSFSLVHCLFDFDQYVLFEPRQLSSRASMSVPMKWSGLIRVFLSFDRVKSFE